MSQMTFEQVLTAVLSLRPEQKQALVSVLHTDASGSSNPAREQLLLELRALRQAGAFERVDSLRNQYYAPSLERVSDEELLSVIHENAVEWETDLGEHSPNGD
jgi:hypothetical protein